MGRLSATLLAFASAAALGFSLPASANPLVPPTVDYTADLVITRPTDHAFEKPARIVYSARHIRIDSVGIVTIVNLDRRETITLIPRVRTYWRPVKLKEPDIDPRRWVGVEARTATPVGVETMLGRQVTKYKVQGTIFETRTPFEGEVWTTPESIVVRAVGTTRVNGANLPIEVSAQQLVIAPADQRAFGIPEKYARAAGDDPNPHREDD